MTQSTQYDVTAINLRRRQALLNTGAVIDISKYLDEDGDETNDPQEALAFVVQFPDGLWYSDAVRSYNPPKTRH